MFQNFGLQNFLKSKCLNFMNRCIIEQLILFEWINNFNYTENLVKDVILNNYIFNLFIV